MQKTKTLTMKYVAVDHIVQMSGQFNMKLSGYHVLRSGRKETITIRFHALHRGELLCLLTKLQAAVKEDLRECNDCSKRFGVAHEWKP